MIPLVSPRDGVRLSSLALAKARKSASASNMVSVSTRAATFVSASTSASMYFSAVFGLGLLLLRVVWDDVGDGLGADFTRLVEWICASACGDGAARFIARDGGLINESESNAIDNRWFRRTTCMSCRLWRSNGCLGGCLATA